MKQKILNYALLATFIITILAPLTGMMVHKMASALFLVLSIVHIVIYRKKMNQKRYVMLGIVVIAFVSGIWSMIFEELSFVLAVHKVISIASVFFLAIHIFVYQRKLKK